MLSCLLILASLVSCVASSFGDISGAPEAPSEDSISSCSCLQCPVGDAFQPKLQQAFCSSDAVLQLRLTHYPYGTPRGSYIPQFANKNTFMDYEVDLWSLRGRAIKAYRTNQGIMINRRDDIILRFQKIGNCLPCETQVWRPDRFVGKGVGEIAEYVDTHSATKYVVFASHLTWDSAKKRFEGLVMQCPTMFRYVKSTAPSAESFVPTELRDLLNDPEGACEDFEAGV
eukprot:sb/3469524/